MTDDEEDPEDYILFCREVEEEIREGILSEHIVVPPDEDDVVEEDHP